MGRDRSIANNSPSGFGECEANTHQAGAGEDYKEPKYPSPANLSIESSPEDGAHARRGVGPRKSACYPRVEYWSLSGDTPKGNSTKKRTPLSRAGNIRNNSIGNGKGT